MRNEGTSSSPPAPTLPPFAPIVPSPAARGCLHGAPFGIGWRGGLQRDCRIANCLCVVVVFSRRGRLGDPLCPRGFGNCLKNSLDNWVPSGLLLPISPEHLLARNPSYLRWAPKSAVMDFLPWVIQVWIYLKN